MLKFILRGENQKGISDIFGEMQISIYQMKAHSTDKCTVIHVCTNLYYKQLKSVHKVPSNYGTIVVLALL